MLEKVFLVVLLAVGVIATATDWQKNRVPNRLILGGLWLFLVGVASQFINTLLGVRGLLWLGLGEYYMPLSYFLHLGGHVLLSVVAGITLWRFDIWPAGDAKLFITLSCLLPLAQANLSGFPFLLFVVFLINCFVPPGLLYMAEAVVRLFSGVPNLFADGPVSAGKAFWDRSAKRLKDFRPFRLEVVAFLGNFMCLFFVMNLIQEATRRQPLGLFGQTMMFFAMLAVWQQLAAVLAQPRLGAVALCVFFAGAVFADFSGLDLASMLARALRAMLGFGFALSMARSFFGQIIDRASLQEIHPDELRPGTLLSDAAWESISQDEAGAEVVEERNCDGLTVEEADALKARMSQRGESSLSVYRTVPFAAWVFLGAIMTLAHRGTVVAWLWAWISQH